MNQEFINVIMMIWSVLVMSMILVFFFSTIREMIQTPAGTVLAFLFAMLLCVTAIFVTNLLITLIK